MGPFNRYLAVDWTGAAGPRHRAIQVAALDHDGAAPVLIDCPDGRAWGRVQLLDWLHRGGAGAGAVIAFDFSFAAPFFDRGAYFPGTDWQARTMRSLWAEVAARAAADPHLQCTNLFADPAFSGQFRQVGGPKLPDYRRFRKTELAWNRPGVPRAESFFHLIGATQVGKGSLCGMRFLHALTGRPDVAVWPLDSRPKALTIVELFTRICLVNAGVGAKKVTDWDCLNAALAALNCGPMAPTGPLTDHAADALISAAFLRNATQTPAYWSPSGLTRKVAEVEAWVFGVR
ncbi:MAG: hypothetical protein ACFB22_05250 [Rhodothalassiaceae bacterium]